MARTIVIAALCAAGLAGCGTVQNTSLLDGSHRFGRAELNTYPVRVLAIDGDYPVDIDPVRVEPGQRILRVSAPPPSGFHWPETRDVAFTVEPCKRYYLAAKRDNPLRRDFSLIVQDVEDRSDCRSE